MAPKRAYGHVKHLKFGKGFKQFIRFGVIGLSNTIVYWIISASLTDFFEDTFQRPYLMGNFAGFVISVAWSFSLNKRYVFKVKDREVLPALLKTYTSYAITGILLNNVLSWLWIDIVGFSYKVAPILNSVIGFPVNYVINKKWTFGKET